MIFSPAKLFFILIAIVCTSSNNIFSQDLKAGEINVKNIGSNLYRATLTFYYETSVFTNRPYLLMNWGDGALDTIPWNLFISGCGDSNTFTKVFAVDHTYLGDGNYLISCVDSFRVTGINNISNSNLEKLSLEYSLSINSFYPPNDSPTSLNCLTDTWTGTTWMYNSAAFDPDGDSLSYNIIAPPGLTNYTFPSYTINNLTGDFTLSPTVIGEYAICIKIDEWKLLPSTTIRNYFGSTYRNLLINVNSLASVNEIFDGGTFVLYPNPATNQITLEFDLIETRNVSIEIKNVFGQTIKTISYNAFTKGSNKIEIDLSELSKGMYFIQLQSENIQFNVQIMDMEGRSIYNNTSDNRILKLKPDVENGVYLVHITNLGTNETFIKKLVIQK